MPEDADTVLRRAQRAAPIARDIEAGFLFGADAVRALAASYLDLLELLNAQAESRAFVDALPNVQLVGARLG